MGDKLAKSDKLNKNTGEEDKTVPPPVFQTGKSRLLTRDQAAKLRNNGYGLKSFSDIGDPEPQPARQITKEEVNAELKSRPDYSEEVQLRLTNLIYDPLATMLFENAGIHPDEAHLLSLTRINSSREAASWAQQITREAIYQQYVHGHTCAWPASQIWRISFLLARRSIPGTCGPGFMLGVGLAQEQQITKEESDQEGKDW